MGQVDGRLPVRVVVELWRFRDAEVLAELGRTVEVNQLALEVVRRERVEAEARTRALLEHLERSPAVRAAGDRVGFHPVAVRAAVSAPGLPGLN